MTEDGALLVNRSNGVVIYVETQYRLSALGFLSGTEVRANGATNAGLLDQRAAIEWVRRHIAAFGGDPTKITLSGGSAGGGSVLAQLLWQGGESNPPFRAAVPSKRLADFTT